MTVYMFTGKTGKEAIKRRIVDLIEDELDGCVIDTPDDIAHIRETTARIDSLCGDWLNTHEEEMKQSTDCRECGGSGGGNAEMRCPHCSGTGKR